MKKLFCVVLILTLLTGSALCAEVVPDPNPPAAEAAEVSAEPSAEVSGEPSGEASGEASAEASGEASAEPSAEPSEEPTEETLTILPGVYENDAGTVLTVNEDNTCTYKTYLSGEVNGSQMSGWVTFHGTVEDNTFSFTSVTWMGFDITSAALEAGFTADQWQTEALEMYAAAVQE